MSVYTSLCSSVLFPLHERLKHHDSVAVRKRLEEQERWPREKLEQWRVNKLRQFLLEVNERVPYYRDLFKRLDFHPHALKSIADLQALPLNDKASMRAAGEGLKAEGAQNLSRYNTGGSSGEPLIFYIGKGRKSHDVGAKWRVTRWWGVDIGDPEIVVWGSPIELGAQDRVRMVRDAVLRTELLPAFEMSEANLDRFVETIRVKRPIMLFGYPSSLSLIAAHARKKGIRLDAQGIKVVFVTSERLYDEQRATITQVFGARVANGYGARDAGFIAHQCPAGGMHLQAEDIIVEIVGPDGQVLPPGQAGEIVVTHTATADFPFIRYRTGDVAVMSAPDEVCGCGRSLPMLKEIQGRTTDFVLAADGTIMHGLALIYTVRDVPGVERFKIIQHSLDHTEVLLVTNPQFSEAGAARIVADYKARLGAGVQVSLTQVDEIPREASGKFRYVVSKVQAGAPRA